MINITFLEAIVIQFLTILEFVIILDVLLSFILKQHNKILSFIRLITLPVLKPFLKFQNKIIKNLSIDFSPVFALIFISIIRRLIFLFF